MTGQRTDFDLGVVLGRWMHDVAPGAVPVPVLEEAFARTMSSRQVRVYPWERLVGRGPRARSGTAFALVAAVALLVALLAFGSLGGGFGVAPAPSPTSGVTSAPSAAPSPSGSSAATDCNNGHGCPSPFPAGPVTSTVFTPKLTFTAPTGYIGYEDTAQTFGVLTAHAGSDQAEFYVFRDPAPSTDDNGCEGDPNQAIGAFTVDSISSAFAADKRFQVTTPVPVTIGPYSGKTFGLQLASTWTGTCPWSNGKPGAMVLTVQGGPTPTSPAYGLGPGDPSLTVYLLDVGGKPIWIQIPSQVAEVIHVLQSLSFAP